MVGEYAPGSAFELLKLNLLMQLPMVIFTPLLGTFLDRWSKSTAILIACAFRAIIVATIPSIFEMNESLNALYAIAFVLSMADLVFGPARSALMPELVEKNRLLEVNAWFWAIGVFAALIGFLGGGWMIDFRSWQMSFYVDAISYAVAAVLMLPFALLHRFDGHAAVLESTENPSNPVKAIHRAVIDAFRLLRQDRNIAIGLLTQAALFAVGGVLSIIAVSRIQEVANDGRAFFLGIIAAATVAGLILGSWLAGVFRERSSVQRTVSVSAILGGVAITGIGRTESLIPLCIWGALMGLSLSPAFIYTETLIQKHSPPEFLGRVFAGREALVKTAFILTAVLSTLATTVYSKSTILVALGLFLALLGVVLERTRWLKPESDDKGD